MFGLSAITGWPYADPPPLHAADAFMYVWPVAIALVDRRSVHMTRGQTLLCSCFATVRRDRGVSGLHPREPANPPRRLRDALRGPGAVRPTAEVSRVGAQRASMDAATPGGLSLVIPAFNEAAVISRAISEAEAALARHFTRFEVLVVDDGSADATADIVRFAPGKAHTRLLRHETESRYTRCEPASRRARFELVAFTDADRQLTRQIWRLVRVAEGVPVGRLSCRPARPVAAAVLSGVQRACPRCSARGYAT